MCRLTTSLVLLAFAVPAFADDKSKKGQMDDEVKKATAKALEWLAAKQNADGSWGDARYPNNTAITGFALMAFMSQGHVPNRASTARRSPRGRGSCWPPPAKATAT